MHRTRNRTPEYSPDPEPERRFRRLLRLQKQQKQACRMSHSEGHSSRPNSPRGGPSSHQGTEEDHHRERFNHMDPIGMINDRDRPMRDYAQFDYQNIQTSISRPHIDAVHFEFKPMMFQMLQTIGQFGGTPLEDPHLHLRQFLEVCSNFILPGVSEDAFKLRLFPYSLKDRAKAWLNSLEPNSIHSWTEMAEKFLGKYFPPIKNARMRTDITSFRQKEFESLFEAWERWKELLRKCPHHGLPVIIQMETFYNGLEPQTRVMLDASSGGVLLNLSYNEACELIDRIAANSSSWPTERVSAQKKPSGVHEVSDITALSAQVATIANLIKNFTSANATASNAAASTDCTAAKIEQAPPGTTSCVYCGGGHLYEECPSNPISVNYVGYNRNNNPYSNTYNPGWRDHPNFRWRDKDAPASKPAPSPGSSPQKETTTENSLENMLKAFIGETRTATQAQNASIKNLETQVGQLATTLQQRPQGALPANTEATPSQKGKEQVKAISLRSGKDLIESNERESVDKGDKEKQKNNKNSNAEATDATALNEEVQVPTPKLVPEYPPPPYPQRLKKAHEEKQFGKFLEVLKQLHINVPLVEALQQMPNYAKFMKDVLTKRKRLGEFETVAMTKECSQIMQNKIPRKLKDPGSFTIPFSIGKSYTGKA